MIELWIYLYGVALFSSNERIELDIDVSASVERNIIPRKPGDEPFAILH